MRPPLLQSYPLVLFFFLLIFPSFCNYLTNRRANERRGEGRKKAGFALMQLPLKDIFLASSLPPCPIDGSRKKLENPSRTRETRRETKGETSRKGREIKKYFLPIHGRSWHYCGAKWRPPLAGAEGSLEKESCFAQAARIGKAISAP